MVQGGSKSPYLWLAQEGLDSSPSDRRWVPLHPSDSERLEDILTQSQNGKGLPASVPIDHGRYDVELERRVMRAVYWDEPDRRVIRSSWFRGRRGAWTPYDEEDGEGLEEAFQRLRTGKELPPLLVPVNRGKDDVRFEALPPENADEDSGAISSMLFGKTSKRQPVDGNLRASDSKVDASSMEQGDHPAQSGDELQFTAIQEAVERSGSQREAVQVWRGYHAFAGEDDRQEDDEEQLPQHVECLTFVVHGIGQYHRAQQGANSQFFKEVARVRKLAAKYQVERAKEQARQGRIEFLPLEWYGPIHVEVGIGNRLKNVTLKSVSHLRDFANFALADVMVYLDEQWRERIHDELLKKMGQLWKLFSARTPNYSGEVAVIGHSLGSVIMFDLIQKGLEKLPCGLHCSPSKDMPQGSSKTAMLCTPAKATVGTPGSFDRKGIKLVKEHVARGNVAALAKSKDGKDLHEHPVPRCLFAVGSPLGMFLSIRLSQKAQRASRYFRGLDVRWPPSSAGQGWRFFNIFHPDDPIAYRIEPLLNPAYTNMSPRVVPHCGGLRWNHRIATLWSSVATPKSGDEVDAEAPLDEVLVVPTEDPSSFFEDKPVRQSIVTVDRLDYALQTTPFESMNEMLSAIHSHFSYWENEDMLQFVVDQIFEAISAGKEGKDDASKGKRGNQADCSKLRPWVCTSSQIRKFASLSVRCDVAAWRTFTASTGPKCRSLTFRLSGFAAKLP